MRFPNRFGAAPKPGRVKLDLFTYSPPVRKANAVGDGSTSSIGVKVHAGENAWEHEFKF